MNVDSPLSMLCPLELRLSETVVVQKQPSALVLSELSEVFHFIELLSPVFRLLSFAIFSAF